MNRTRCQFILSAICLFGIVSLGTVVMPVAGYNSVTEELLRSLHRRLLWIAVPLALFVEALLFYAALRFHKNDNPKPTEDKRWLEVTWTIAVALILLFVGASSYLVLANPMMPSVPESTPSDTTTVNVHITGQNWFWEFSYPNAGVTTTNTLVIPSNRTVTFSITSRDVVHSVHIPSLGIKQDAIPGRTNTFTTTPTNTGTYRLYCAEFCGTGHSKMLATVKVVSPEAYQQWLRRQQRTQGTNTSVRSPHSATPSANASG